MKTIEQVDQQRLSTAIQQMDRSAVDKQQQEEGLVQIAPNEQNTIEEADVARVVDAGEEHSVPDEEPDAPGTLQGELLAEEKTQPAICVQCTSRQEPLEGAVQAELEQQESALLERATGTLGNVEAAKRDGDQLMLAQRRRDSAGTAEGSLVRVARSTNRPPDTDLALEHVYGYNGADAMGNNVYYADDAESILYTVASVAALQCRTTRRQTIFQGHTDEVSCLAVSPDGDLVATGQFDTTAAESQQALVIVWDLRTGRPMMEFAQHAVGVCALAFLSGSDRLVSVGLEDPQVIAVWDCGRSPRLLGTTVQGHKQNIDAVHAVVAHPVHNDEFATCGRECVKFWRYTGEGQHPVHCVWSAASPLGTTFRCATFLAGDHLVAGLSTGDLVSIEAGCQHAILPGHGAEVAVLRRLPDRGVLSLCSRFQVLFWNRRLRVTHSFDLRFGEPGIGVPRAADWNERRRRLLLGTSCNRIWEFDLSEIVRVCRTASTIVEGHPGELTAMAAHPFLPFVASADDTRAVRLLDTEERMHVRTLRPFDSNVSCMTFTPSGNQLAFALCSGRVVLMEFPALRSATAEARLDDYDVGTVLRVSAKRNVLFVAGVCSIHLLDLGTLRRLRMIRVPFPVATIDVSNAGDHVAVSGHGWCPPLIYQIGEDHDRIRDDITGLDVGWTHRTCFDGGVLSGCRRHDNDLSRLAVSTSGSVVAVADHLGLLHLYRFPCQSEGACAHVQRGHASPLVGLWFTKDDAQVIAGGRRDYMISQWRHRTIVADQAPPERAPAAVVDDTPVDEEPVPTDPSASDSVSPGFIVIMNAPPERVAPPAPLVNAVAGVDRRRLYSALQAVKARIHVVEVRCGRQRAQVQRYTSQLQNLKRLAAEFDKKTTTTTTSRVLLNGATDRALRSVPIRPRTVDVARVRRRDENARSNCRRLQAELDDLDKELDEVQQQLVVCDAIVEARARRYRASRAVVAVERQLKQAKKGRSIPAPGPTDRLS
ncbi:WD domain, G-beta repeat [Plasmodiophora brassicae]